MPAMQWLPMFGMYWLTMFGRSGKFVEFQQNHQNCLIATRVSLQLEILSEEHTRANGIGLGCSLCLSMATSNDDNAESRNENSKTAKRQCHTTE
jgi:hypothetical protein